MSRPLRKGIYAPIPTFFNEIEDVEHANVKRQVLHLAKAGIIPVLCTSFGEADHLSHEERFQIISVSRTGLDENGMGGMPVLAGITASSTREAINFALESASAGADYVLAGAPGVYAKYLDKASIAKYFVDIAASSPIPVILLNCPIHAAGIDLDSDLILDVLRAAPNVCGVMLTDGTIGKLTRIIATVNCPTFKTEFPRKDPTTEVLVFNGHMDSLLPAASVGCAGTLTILANFSPRLCLRLWKLSQQNRADGSLLMLEAQQLQSGLADAEWSASKNGIPGMKALLDAILHLGAKPRRPLCQLPADAVKRSLEEPALQTIFKFEILETMKQARAGC